jgi:hypothetical protein
MGCFLCSLCHVKYSMCSERTVGDQFLLFMKLLDYSGELSVSHPTLSSRTTTNHCNCSYPPHTTCAASFGVTLLKRKLTLCVVFTFTIHLTVIDELLISNSNKICPTILMLARCANTCAHICTHMRRCRQHYNTSFVFGAYGNVQRTHAHALSLSLSLSLSLRRHTIYNKCYQ